MSNMAGQQTQHLNLLEKQLPEGLLVTSSWLIRHGYSRQLLSHYVRTGWLRQPMRGVYQRPRGSLSWQQIVISLQTVLKEPLVVGGRTALEIQGYAHYLRQSMKEVLPLRTRAAAELARESPGEGQFHLSQQPETLPGGSGPKIVHEPDQGRQGAAEPRGRRRLSRPALGAVGLGPRPVGTRASDP